MGSGLKRGILQLRSSAFDGFERGLGGFAFEFCDTSPQELDDSFLGCLVEVRARLDLRDQAADGLDTGPGRARLVGVRPQPSLQEVRDSVAVVCLQSGEHPDFVL